VSLNPVSSYPWTHPTSGDLLIKQLVRHLLVVLRNDLLGTLSCSPPTNQKKDGHQRHSKHEGRVSNLSLLSPLLNASSAVVHGGVRKKKPPSWINNER